MRYGRWGYRAVEMIERVARALCEAEGHKPDQLEPGDAVGIDGYMGNGDPAHFLWREWSDKARAAIGAMREPTEAMVLTQGKSRPDLARTETQRSCAERLNRSVQIMAVETWHEMIEAALSNNEPPER